MLGLICKKKPQFLPRRLGDLTLIAERLYVTLLSNLPHRGGEGRSRNEVAMRKEYYVTLVPVIICGGAGSRLLRGRPGPESMLNPRGKLA